MSWNYISICFHWWWKCVCLATVKRNKMLALFIPKVTKVCIHQFLWQLWQLLQWLPPCIKWGPSNEMCHELLKTAKWQLWPFHPQQPSHYWRSVSHMLEFVETIEQHITCNSISRWIMWKWRLDCHAVAVSSFQELNLQSMPKLLQ